MDSKYGWDPGHYPDGLTEPIIDALLRELDIAAAAKPRAISALADGTGEQRRRRRRVRRYTAAMVRTWPGFGAPDDTGGWAA